MRLAAALLIVAACASDPAAPAPGRERAPCNKGACDQGLICLSDRCVRPPGADCAQVAEALTSIELGNYASPEERAPKVTAYRAKCEAAMLTRDEGACVIAARTMDDLRACPKPVMFPPYVPTVEGEPIKGLPAVCTEYLLTLERYARCTALPVESRKAIAQAVASMRKSWSMFSEATPMPQAVSDACKQGNDAIRGAMVSFQCK